MFLTHFVKPHTATGHTVLFLISFKRAGSHSISSITCLCCLSAFCLSIFFISRTACFSCVFCSPSFSCIGWSLYTSILSKLVTLSFVVSKDDWKSSTISPITSTFFSTMSCLLFVLSILVSSLLSCCCCLSSIESTLSKALSTFTTVSSITSQKSDTVSVSSLTVSKDSCMFLIDCSSDIAFLKGKLCVCCSHY